MDLDFQHLDTTKRFATHQKNDPDASENFGSQAAEVALISEFAQLEALHICEALHAAFLTMEQQ
jgi:hypothetical protein